MLGLNFYAMGCQMQALAVGNSPKLEQRLQDLVLGFDQAEQRFSRFIVDSELMQLNQQQSLAVSPEFWQLLQHSLASARLTQGLITPTVYSQLIQRGYTTSFDKLSQRPHSDNVAQPSQAEISEPQHWQNIVLNESNHEVTLLKATKLDFGGFAKVLTAYHTAQMLANLGTSVLVDTGGDIVTVGAHHLGLDNAIDVATEPWQVALPSAHEIKLPINEGSLPTRRRMHQLPKDWQLISQDALIYLPTDRTHILATSGIDYRYWYHGHSLQHHLINPLEHEAKHEHSEVVCASILVNETYFYENQAALHPAIDHFLQTSNVCNLAQTLSKLLCLLGLNKGVQWLDKHGLQGLGVSLIIATTTGYEHWLNPAMQVFCAKNNKD